MGGARVPTGCIAWVQESQCPSASHPSLYAPAMAKLTRWPAWVWVATYDREVQSGRVGLGGSSSHMRVDSLPKSTLRAPPAYAPCCSLLLTVHCCCCCSLIFCCALPRGRIHVPCAAPGRRHRCIAGSSSASSTRCLQPAAAARQQQQPVGKHTDSATIRGDRCRAAHPLWAPAAPAGQQQRSCQPSLV